jgi:hypothetical protein
VIPSDDSKDSVDFSYDAVLSVEQFEIESS